MYDMYPNSNLYSERGSAGLGHPDGFYYIPPAERPKTAPSHDPMAPTELINQAMNGTGVEVTEVEES